MNDLVSDSPTHHEESLLLESLTALTLALDALPELSPPRSTEAQPASESHDGEHALSALLQRQHLLEWSELLAGRDTLDHALDESIEHTNTRRDELSTKVDTLQDELQARTSQTHDEDTRLRDAQGESDTSLNTLNTSLQERHPERAEDVFDRLKHALESGCLDVVDQGFDQFRGRLDAGFERYHEEVETSGSGWSQAAGHLLGDTAHDVANVVADELREAVANLLHHVVEAVVEEVAEHVASSMTGATTTTALAPILPQLVMIRAILRRINDLLDFFD